ncbi:MAG: GNAT family N-acetyltransferase [Planctomycetota bacterium]|jgi:GNAT superfamily N-acetyltransferase
MEEITLTVEENASGETKKKIVQGLQNYNVGQTGDNRVDEVSVVLRDGKGEVVGGLLAEVAWGWMHIFILWVAESKRRMGWGGKLLEEAEGEAKRRGCARVHLDTFSFQSCQFYRKRGYEEFGRLEAYPKGETRHFLRKSLKPD